MKLKLTEIAETQYKISMSKKIKHLKEINFTTLKISHKYNVLTSFKKTLKTPFNMFLEDFQFR
jgi:uncharacterized protein involved in exopolysaccharide biosynthesis